MTKVLQLEERLVVAADFKPDDYQGFIKDQVRTKVLRLADELAGTGVYLKVNSVLRACGYTLMNDIRLRGLRTFADLKLFDIGETLSTDGVLLREFEPQLLTVVCSAGVSAMRALKTELPKTEILGVTVLTSLTDSDAEQMFSCGVEEAVMRFARIGSEAGIEGLICSPKEAEGIRGEFGVSMTINTPAIRPAWSVVKGDDQNLKRVMTPRDAIEAGADRVIIGRPITGAKERYDAVMRTLEEISSAA